MIYLRLSSTTVSALKLKADSDFLCEVQFQLNRIPYCEWHYAIDKIPDYKIIFPDTYLEPNIPWTPQRYFFLKIIVSCCGLEFMPMKRDKLFQIIIFNKLLFCRQWNDMIDSRLNLKQREAVVAITTPMTTPLPPILIIGLYSSFARIFSVIFLKLKIC